MSETTETTRARRRLKLVGEIRTLFAMVIGAAACLAVISAIRLFSGQSDVFPEVLVPLLVIVGVVGDRLTWRRYTEALEDVELAARNAGRAAALEPEPASASAGVAVGRR